MAHARAAAVAAAREIRRALDEVVEAFGQQKVASDRLIALLEGAEPVRHVVANFGVPRERQQMVTALDLYETRRRESRIAMWRLLLAEGCSIGDLSRIFGLSRQLVSRQLKEDDAKAR